MQIVAQWVRTTWTKRSRGGADEHSLFKPSWHLLPELEDVQLVEAEGRLRVQLVATPFGFPRRWRRPPAVRLASGEWLRWQINYRFPGPCCCGEQSYRQDTLNLAYGRVSANVFSGVPTRHVDERAHLH